MRNVVSSLFISLDGVVESPDQWQFDVFDDDFMAAMTDELAQADTALLGRVSYEQWSAFWPDSQDEPFASFINNIPKYVVSTTLNKVAWGGFDSVHLLEGGLVEGVSRLKQQPGKVITVSGSISLVQSLLQHNLLDELRLYVHPVIAGKGKRLFKEGADLKRLKLFEHKATKSGVAILKYQI